jgi:hypothetical protein
MRSEVITVVTAKIVLWDVMLCSLMDVCRRFRVEKWTVTKVTWLT